MTSKRVAYKLDQLGFVGRGRSRHRPRNDPSLYGGKYPFFQTGDVKSAEFYLNNYSATYNEKGLAQSRLWQPGTLCITIAANIAETAILNIPGCFPDSVVGFIANPDKADAAFVKYYFETLKMSMQNVSRGTTQDNLSLDKLLSFDFLVPSVVVQEQIASVLRSYDELIENNTYRIEILEEMARRLFEEWFIHLRFPGHEDVVFRESEHGRIPEGWETVNLEDVVDLTMGQSPKSEFYNDREEGLPFHQGVTDFGDYFPTNRLYCTAENRVGEEGDILFSVRAPVGRINISKEKIVIGRGVSALRSKTGHQIFLLSQLQNIFQEEDSIGNGAIFKSVTKRDMQTIRLVQPDGHYIASFESTAGYLWKQIRVLSDQNINLRTQRDLLLPKLVTGEIDVSSIAMADEKATEIA